jgi:hypothetical protein
MATSRRTPGLLRILLAAIALVACCSRGPSEPASGAPWFEDVTAAAGVDFVHDSGHRDRYFLPEAVAGGCAIFDYDGDGWMDLYFTQAGPIREEGAPPAEAAPRKGASKGNRLFRNRRDGKASAWVAPAATTTATATPTSSSRTWDASSSGGTKATGLSPT